MVQPRQWDGSGLVFFKSNLEHFRAPEVWEGREYLHSVVPLLIGLRTELGVKRMGGTGAAAAVVEDSALVVRGEVGKLIRKLMCTVLKTRIRQSGPELQRGISE